MSIDERMHWIEACLRYAGGLPKRALMRRFGISAAQVSSDLRRFVTEQNDRGGNLEVRAGKIAGDLPEQASDELPHPADLLAATSIVPFESIDRVLRASPEPEVLARLIDACRARHVLRVIYCSISSGRAERQISVNRFVEAGGRLHVRVFDHGRNEFVDYVLSRIEKVLGVEPAISAVGPDQDEEFTRFVTVRLIANPVLDLDQRGAVCRDYGLDLRHGRILRIRKCDLFYLRAEYGDVSGTWVPPVLVEA